MPLLDVLKEPPSVPLSVEHGLPVVIDVLRATTTIVTALFHGAGRIRTFVSTEQARAECPEGSLLAGERGGLKPEGFDLGNSPLEYVREKIENRLICLTTTNGTRAMEFSKVHFRPLCLAFSNLSATADYLGVLDGVVTAVCSGSDGEACLEDFFLAGALAFRLQDVFELSPSAQEAAAVFSDHRTAVESYLQAAPHGRRLAELGFQKDLEYCALLDTCPIVTGMDPEGYIVKLARSPVMTGSNVI